MMECNTILEMEKEIKGRIVKLEDIHKEKTVLVVVDMVKGFVTEGILSSPRINTIIETILAINEKATGCKKIFFLDEHDENSIEFNCYAKHCLKGTSEAELIDELKSMALADDNTVMIPKNSTNGFHAPGFKIWLEKYEKSIENFIVVGCEADICVSHFATTLKTYFNQNNLDRRIIVPARAVETFDFGTHKGDFMKIVSLWEMKSNGIEIVEDIV